MFGIGETELVIIVVFGFLLFGPDKLPGMGRTIGRALRQFREAQEGFTQVVQSEVMDPLNDAMNAPINKVSKANQDDDSDLEGTDGEVAARKSETFAERKARLQAERKAKAEEEKRAAEAAAAKAEQAAQEDADAPAAENEQASEAAAPAETVHEEATEEIVAPESTETAPAEEPEPKEEVAPNSVAALYAMAPRKRAPKPEPKPEPEPEAETTPAVEIEPEAPAADSLTDDAPGKEDGSEA